MFFFAFESLSFAELQPEPRMSDSHDQPHGFVISAALASLLSEPDVSLPRLALKAAEAGLPLNDTRALCWLVVCAARPRAALAFRTPAPIRTAAARLLTLRARSAHKLQAFKQELSVTLAVAFYRMLLLEKQMSDRPVERHPRTWHFFAVCTGEVLQCLATRSVDPSQMLVCALVEALMYVRHLDVLNHLFVSAQWGEGVMCVLQWVLRMGGVSVEGRAMLVAHVLTVTVCACRPDMPRGTLTAEHFLAIASRATEAVTGQAARPEDGHESGVHSVAAPVAIGTIRLLTCVGSMFGFERLRPWAPWIGVSLQYLGDARILKDVYAQRAAAMALYCHTGLVLKQNPLACAQMAGKVIVEYVATRPTASAMFWSVHAAVMTTWWYSCEADAGAGGAVACFLRDEHRDTLLRCFDCAAGQTAEAGTGVIAVGVAQPAAIRRCQAPSECVLHGTRDACMKLAAGLMAVVVHPGDLSVADAMAGALATWEHGTVPSCVQHAVCRIQSVASGSCV